MIDDWDGFKRELEINKQLREEMADACVRYEVVNGLTYSDYNLKDFSTSSYKHLPFSLLPAMIDIGNYENLCKISKYLHKFIDGMSRDVQFLIQTLKPILTNDVFLSRYIEIYERQLKLNEFNQPISMGIYRTDYMQNADMKWGQIEINVAGVGGFFAAQKMNDLRRWSIHRYAGICLPIYNNDNGKIINNHTNDCTNDMKEDGNTRIFLPNVTSFDCCVRTLATAAKLVHPLKPLVMIIHPINTETGIIDQSAIDFELFNKYNVVCIRRSMRDLCKGRIKLDVETKELIVDDVHRISCVFHHQNQTSYYLKSFENEGFDNCMNVIQIIEFSTAIKQNMGYTLMGTKIIQALYSTFSLDNNILYRYLEKSEAQLIQKYCFNVYCLDVRLDKNASIVIADAQKNYNNYVLKPNRDGGGNNFFDEEVKIQIDKMLMNENANALSAYILMEKIDAISFDAWFVNQRQCSKIKSNAEVGIFSCYLASESIIYVDEVCGSYCKTKNITANEAGIKAGNGVIDSCILRE